jgi:hypothetical protein
MKFSVTMYFGSFVVHSWEVLAVSLADCFKQVSLSAQVYEADCEPCVTLLEVNIVRME